MLIYVVMLKDTQANVRYTRVPNLKAITNFVETILNILILLPSGLKKALVRCALNYKF